MAVNKAGLALAVLAGVGLWAYWRRGQLETWLGPLDKVGGAVGDFGNVIGKAVSDVGVFLKLSNMSSFDRDLMAHPNVRAMLMLIRHGEGTLGENGYRTIFGGQLFTGWADHPRIKVTKWGHTSTAAGAYQFLSEVWDETRRFMKLPDFSPATQDLAAVGRMAARGVLDEVVAGDVRAALNQLSYEWASLPPKRYKGQGKISTEQAVRLFVGYGGKLKA